jgi:hypothetical protein
LPAQITATNYLAQLNRNQKVVAETQPQWCFGVFRVEGSREKDAIQIFDPVLVIDLPDGINLMQQVVPRADQRDGRSILVTLSGPDGESASFKIDVFDSQAETFVEAQNAAIDKHPYEG